MTAISTSLEPANFIQLIGHTLRWQLVRLLARSDLRVQDLILELDRPQNLVSYHIRMLLSNGLVRENRSSHDRREIYYSLDLERFQALYFAAADAVFPGLSGAAEDQTSLAGAVQRPRVLFLCTHNSARSQIAEGLLRALGKGAVEVFSAGTEATRIHPLAIRAMQELNVDISGQYSKSLAEFIGQAFDYIITVCDRAKESCPIFPGDPERIHWSFPDPAAVEGSEEERYRAFRNTAIEMKNRISYLGLMLRRKYNLDFQ